MGQAWAGGRYRPGICVCVWFFKNLTHFCHVLVHQNSKGGGSVKNVLTRNFVRVPGSPGLLPLPQSPRYGASKPICSTVPAPCPHLPIHPSFSRGET